MKHCIVTFVSMFNQNNRTMKTQIENILNETLPKFHNEVRTFKDMSGGECLAIIISASEKWINNVRGQYPQAVSLALWADGELSPQVFGGNGGNRIYREPNKEHPREKYLVMVGEKIPFRTPKKDDDKAILRAVRRFAENYKAKLIEHKETLMYKDMVDYDYLLS